MKMNKQIVMTMFSVLLGAMLIGGGTYAYFSSTVTSTDNTFSAGKIVLDNTKSESVKFAFTNVQPGSTQTKGFKIDNTTSTLDSKLTAKLEYTPSAPDLASQLIVTSLKFAGDDITSPVAAKTVGTDLTLSDLRNVTFILAENLDHTAGEKIFEVGIKFDDTAETNHNIYQDKSIIDAKFTFEARQK